jgi:Pyruvate/2-oxoacid:ferredoxin oxidoreductase delta subunit
VGNQEPTFHFVSTWAEAEKLIAARDAFWVSECGCRIGNEAGCKRSPTELCVAFSATELSQPDQAREVPRSELDALVAEYRRSLVARPFHSEKQPDGIGGICFCCDDCCAYFLDPALPCDRGAMIETTDAALCTACGTCVAVCHFGARAVSDGALAADADACAGCGLCAEVCPTGAARMAARA